MTHCTDVIHRKTVTKKLNVCLQLVIVQTSSFWRFFLAQVLTVMLLYRVRAHVLWHSMQAVQKASHLNMMYSTHVHPL